MFCSRFVKLTAIVSMFVLNVSHVLAVEFTATPGDYNLGGNWTGGSVPNGVEAVIGSNANPNVTANLNAAAPSNPSSLYVGRQQNGTLNIGAAGVLTVDNQIILGESNTAVGTLDVQGLLNQSSNDFQIGTNGEQQALTVTGSGEIRLTGANNRLRFSSGIYNGLDFASTANQGAGLISFGSDTDLFVGFSGNSSTVSMDSGSVAPELREMNLAAFDGANLQSGTLNIDNTTVMANGTVRLGGEGRGFLNISNNGILQLNANNDLEVNSDPDQALPADRYSDINLTTGGQIQMTGGSQRLRFAGGNWTNAGVDPLGTLSFADTANAGAGLISLHSNTDLYVGFNQRDTTLEIDSTSVTPEFREIRLASFDGSNLVTGTLNIDNTLVEANGVVSLGGEGRGFLNISNNGILRLNANNDLEVNTDPDQALPADRYSDINLTTGGQIQLTGASQRLRFAGGNWTNAGVDPLGSLSFADTANAAGGRISLHNNTDLFVGFNQRDTTLEIDSNSVTPEFREINLAAFDNSNLTTGTLSINNNTVKANGAVRLGGEGRGFLNISNNGILQLVGNNDLEVRMDPDQALPADRYSDINLTTGGQIQVVGGSNRLRFAGGNWTNAGVDPLGTLNFADTANAAAGRISLHSNTDLFVGFDQRDTTLEMDSNSVTPEFREINLAAFDNSNLTTGTLNIDNVTVKANGAVRLGGEGRGILNFANGGILELNGNNDLEVRSDPDQPLPTRFSQLNLGATGEIRFTGGSNRLRLANGDMTLDLTNAATPNPGMVTVHSNTDLFVGYDARDTTLNLDNDSNNTLMRELNIAAFDNSGNVTGTLNIDTASLSFGGAVRIGGEGNGNVNLANGAVLNANNELDLRTQASRSSAITGNGQVNVTNQFRMNGRVVADGGDLTVAFGSLENNIESAQGDSTQPGWYAQNAGKLNLPDLSISGDLNWGEKTSDTQPDLVNSVRFTNWDQTGGTLAGSLLADDQGSVFAGLVNAVGIWDFETTGAAFTSVDMTFRYDDALAGLLGVAENDLKLFKNDGGGWTQLAAIIDDGNNLLSTTGVGGFSQFAIAESVSNTNPSTGTPEPSTLILAVLALAGMMAARSRRRWTRRT